MYLQSEYINRKDKASDLLSPELSATHAEVYGQSNTNRSREAERQLYPYMRRRWKAAQGGKVTVWQRVKFYAFGHPP